MSTPDPEDLTARARIRDAAMRQFGEHGFERATIRGIADAAGVSSGLVRHHFGSKQGLREACDDFLVKGIRRLNDEVRRDAGRNYVAVARTAFGPYQPYLARALAEGAAAEVFDAMAELSAQWLAEADKKRPDPPAVPVKARATVGTAMALAVSVLREHVSRGLGVEVFSPAGDDLLARVLLDIYSHPWLSPEEAAALQARLDTKEDNDD
ncbi:TetR/AcrR family transcriptional regulator [Nonomuraea typhae]|uniref:TetR/AcrR family transcriptional regulator n=1 Tax=Nonomuraea typhae TaxID=2603600 RepID=UPI0012FA6678|nr:TetR/AcrR family transcriptional regulator [Nonomuraea typhae]